MTSDELYNASPRAKTIEGFIEALNIMAKHKKKGLKCFCPLEAGHDEIYLDLTEEEVAEDSIDGQRLLSLGFHMGDDGWSYFC